MFFFFLKSRRPLSSTRTDTLYPYTTRFRSATALADLKAESSWSRDDFVTEGGWLTVTGLTEPVDGAADLCADARVAVDLGRSEEHTSELQSLMRNSYAVFCLNKIRLNTENSVLTTI